MTRREALINAETVLEDENKLKEYLGKDPYFDCTLFLLAQQSEVWLERLSKYVNIDDLRNDVAHVAAQIKLREAKKNKFGGLL